MSKLFSQMDAVCHRFEELSVRLNQPETAADPALFRRLMQEYREAEPVVQAYQALTTARDHLAQARALLEGETLEPDFKEMVQQELSEKSQEVAQLENNLKILLLPRDVNDGKSVIMELRGGAGGEEAALFAHSLMRIAVQSPPNNEERQSALREKASIHLYRIFSADRSRARDSRSLSEDLAASRTRASRIRRSASGSSA